MIIDSRSIFERMDTYKHGVKIYLRYVQHDDRGVTIDLRYVQHDKRGVTIYLR